MLFVTSISTSQYLYLFVTLFGLGWAHDGSNHSKEQCFVSQSVGAPLLTPTTPASVIRTADPDHGVTLEKDRPCSVPPQPANGVRKTHERYCSSPDHSEDCDLIEGDAFLPENVMNYTCDLGYKIRGSPFVMCDRFGKWSPIPECIEVKCDPLNSSSMTGECLRNERWVSNCDSPELVGTVARPSCRSGYKLAMASTNRRDKNVKCNMNGKWEPEPMRCVPVCGRVTGALGANTREFPWHASIYKQTAIGDDDKYYVCSGTVIERNLVLTAAHCVFDKDTNRPLDPRKFFVMAGHTIEVWNHAIHDSNVNKIAVKNVYINCDFRSVNRMQSASDIALLEVDQPFEFSHAIAPACLEDYESSEQTLDPGAYGRIAVTGTVQHHYSTRLSLDAKRLSIKTVPYMSYDECKSSGDVTWPRSLANDQFCAGHSRSSACVHSTGGGLIFERNGLWYVTGIVSKPGIVSSHRGRNQCNHLAIYTNVSAHTPWIRDVLLDLDRYKSHPPCDCHGPSISTEEMSKQHQNFPRMEDMFCPAPPRPANGEWKYTQFEYTNEPGCNVRPGTQLRPGSQLLYSCDRGYKLNGTAEVYCRYTGKWSTIPVCIEIKCESLNSESRRADCTDTYGHYVSCDSPVRPGTRAQVRCPVRYETVSTFATTRRKDVLCMEDGMWLPEPIECLPVCGVEITRQKPFVVNGTDANVGDFPWHATLYRQTDSPEMRKEFICGATIIHTNLLLTAAHCVYDDSTWTLLDPKKLFVATGNRYRDYDSPLNGNLPISKSAVKNVYVHCHYYGFEGNYQSDIALLELQTSFKLSAILLPACLDLSQMYTQQILQPGVNGTIVGFGRTAKSKTSDVLQTAKLPYIPLNQCQESTSTANVIVLSNDKFCAGYTTGPAACEGDSGGGLVFRRGNLWYVLGIVSVGLETNYGTREETCGKHPYSLYTRVSDYVPWIRDVMFKLEKYGSYPPCRIGG